MCGCKHTFGVSWGLGHGVRGLGVRGVSGHGTLNTGWNIMMCGCKDTFRVSWGLGQGVRGLGVRGASGHGTMNIGWNIMMCGCKHTFRVSEQLPCGRRNFLMATSNNGAVQTLPATTDTEWSRHKRHKSRPLQATALPKLDIPLKPGDPARRPAFHRRLLAKSKKKCSRLCLSVWKV